MRIFASLFVMGFACVSTAQTWTVDDDGPADFNDIQSAVNAASSGDEIVVFPGTYTGFGENTVEINNKTIDLRSQDGHGVTIIDGLSQRRGISCRFGSNSLIEGFTIRNGYHGEWEGGGIFNQSNYLTVKNCIVEQCTATRGGAVRNEEATQPLFINCTFRNNSANSTGGAINNNYCLATFKNCLIENNTAGTNGGGVMNWGDWYDSVYENCVIRNNTANAGGGMYNHQGSPQLTDTVVCGNSASQIEGPWTDLGDNTIESECVDDCTGDLDGNGDVGVDDLLTLLAAYSQNANGDCDDDGDTDVDDILTLISAWGACP